MVLEPIYEQGFLPGSYGFRPGRSADQALATERAVPMGMGGGWVPEIDIEAFFDTLDHGPSSRRTTTVVGDLSTNFSWILLNSRLDRGC
jgi:retron-type reverse transcriptase